VQFIWPPSHALVVSHSSTPGTILVYTQPLGFRVMWLQVFASGTGNRRHPLFFLSGPHRWACRKLGISIADDDVAVDSSDLAAVTAANPLPPHSSSKGAVTSRFLSPRGGRPSSELQLPIRSPTPVGAAGGSSVSSSVAPLMGSSPSKAAAGMLDGTGAVPDSSADATGAAAAADAALLSGFSEPEDVAAERLRVENLTDLERNPIVVRQLNKTYPGQDGQPPKVGSCVVLSGSLLSHGSCYPIAPLLSNLLYDAVLLLLLLLCCCCCCWWWWWWWW
jgi:hypothetical protein